MLRTTSRLSLIAGLAMLALFSPLTVSTAHATLPNLNEVAALTASTAVPGSTVRATGTFTPSFDLGSVRVAVSLLSSAGAGSLTFVSSSARLTNCSVDGTGRVVGCDFLNATAADGAQQIVVDINVGAGATVGGNWTFETGSGLLNDALTLSGNPQTLTIVAPPTTTAATTTTTPATTAAATTTPATTTPATTTPATTTPATTVRPTTTGVAGAGGGLPSVGFGGQTALIAALFVAIGGVAIGASRRRVTR
jgi:hypothetical protein